VDAYRTEDEQLEALKRWWKENGTSTLLSIVLVLGGYFGWQAWQTRQQQQAEVASAAYQELLQLSMEIEQEATDTRYATASHLAETLKTDFPGSVYAQYAALMQAKLQVTRNDLAAAEAELRWVLASEPELALLQVSKLRLARVLFASDQADQALSLINAADYGEFAGAYYELRGDIETTRGNIEAARQAYQNALDHGPAASGAAPLVRLKLESLPRDTSVDENAIIDED
jgi:predicted negative regulator of RcsB-dependent stress response